MTERINLDARPEPGGATERELRGRLALAGYRLTRRRGTEAPDFGRYWVTRVNSNTDVLGRTEGVTLATVEEWWRRLTAARAD